MLTLRPFLEGKGPTLEIDLAQGSLLATWAAMHMKFSNGIPITIALVWVVPPSYTRPVIS